MNKVSPVPPQVGELGNAHRRRILLFIEMRVANATECVHVLFKAWILNPNIFPDVKPFPTVHADYVVGLTHGRVHTMGPLLVITVSWFSPLYFGLSAIVFIKALTVAGL
jgi:hypothetical protein